MSHLRPDHRPGLLLPVLLRSGLRLLPLLQVLLRLWVRRLHIHVHVHIFRPRLNTRQLDRLL